MQWRESFGRCVAFGAVVACAAWGGPAAAAGQGNPQGQAQGQPQPVAQSLVGSVVAFAGPADRIPTGWLLCDGRAVKIADYPELYEAIGTAWGAGDGRSTFALPDLRGRFLRGADLGAGRDPDAQTRGASAYGGFEGDEVGTVQGDTLQSHLHADPGHSHVDAGHRHEDGGHTHEDLGHTHVDSGHVHEDNGHTHVDSGHTHTDRGHGHTDLGHTHVDSGHSHPASTNGVTGTNIISDDADDRTVGLITGAASVSIGIGRAQIQSAKAQITEGKADITSGQANIQTASADIQSARAAIQSAKANLATSHVDVLSAQANIQVSKTGMGEPVAADAGPARHGRETRPVNAAVVYIIRAVGTGR